MFRRLTTLALALSVALTFALASPAPAAAGARVDPKLEAALARGGEVHAIAFFNHPVTAADKARLLAAGATLAVPYTRWPWAGVVGAPAAIRAVAAFPDITEMQWAPPSTSTATRASRSSAPTTCGRRRPPAASASTAPASASPSSTPGSTGCILICSVAS